MLALAAKRAKSRQPCLPAAFPFPSSGEALTPLPLSLLRVPLTPHTITSRQHPASSFVGNSALVRFMCCPFPLPCDGDGLVKGQTLGRPPASARPPTQHLGFTTRHPVNHPYASIYTSQEHTQQERARSQHRAEQDTAHKIQEVAWPESTLQDPHSAPSSALSCSTTVSALRAQIYDCLEEEEREGPVNRLLGPSSAEGSSWCCVEAARAACTLAAVPAKRSSGQSASRRCRNGQRL